jgi:tetratricopeptide (TPR) repeat protein
MPCPCKTLVKHMPNRLEQIKKMIETDGREPFLLFALAKEYEKTGAAEMAEKTYEKLIEEFPAYTGTYYHLVHLKVKSGKLMEAKAIGERGLKVCKQERDEHAFRELRMLVDSII